MEICKELGMEKIPVIVRNLSDEQAVSMMVDANLHRDNILPSEHLDLKHQVPFRNHLFKLRDREVRLQNEMGSGKKIRKDFVVGCDKDEKR